jgi:membrane protease YdiL (CAAX protease family)
VPLRWYVFAVGYMAGVKLVSAVVHRVAAGAWPSLAVDQWYLMLLATVLTTVTGGQAGEELGWRGYALPGLAARIGMRGSSILLGLIWAFWHLPLFYIAGADTTGQSFPAYAIGVTGLSVAIAWLYSNTEGSLLLTMLMHAAINNTKDIVPSVPRPASNPLLPGAPLLTWVVPAVIWATAIYFLARMPRTVDGREIVAH